MQLGEGERAGAVDVQLVEGAPGGVTVGVRVRVRVRVWVKVRVSFRVRALIWGP